ncbi:MAG TPA: Vms1/Ankzf1 family peptidyl-tRNA hydrolase, partial [Bryobacteraceae bacterium]|nr:Vms1/Ankzf1 family peptidyl-tRNA hydrolase [Bryobacteraceae bacterium]
ASGDRPMINNLIDRLSAWEPNGFPVVSLYLNTKADQHGRDNYQAFVRKELKARSKAFAPNSSEGESFEKDASRIQQYLAGELNPSANGAVIFACAGADLFEAVQLDAPIDEHRLYVYNQPHLYQLAKLNDEFPRYAAVIADTNLARIFVFGLGTVVSKEEIKGTKTKSVKVGGWSQQRYRRHIENYHLHHVKEIVEILGRVVAAEGARHVVLAGDEVILPKLREQLPQALQDKIVDVLRLDVNAPETDILTATLDSMREQDSKEDAEKVARMFEQYRAGGLAVAGVRNTLAALDMGQVDELLVSAALEQFHPEEEEVERPIAMTSGGGLAATEPPKEIVMLPDELVTKAAQTSAQVSFIQDAALLESVGGVAAFLRYRT